MTPGSVQPYEFKKPFRLASVATRGEALDQIYRYLEDVSKKHSLQPSRLQGLVTDGQSAVVIAYSFVSKGFVTADTYEKTVPESDAFVPLTEAAVWLERVQRSLSRRELSPENLLQDLGPGTSLWEDLVRASWGSYAQRRREERVLRFYQQWRVLFSTATERLISGHELA